MTLTKMIYLAKRNPDIAAEDFPRRWRKHAILAAQFPQLAKSFVRVAQCTNARRPDQLPQSSQDYDGVNLLALSHRGAVEEIWNDPDTKATMRPDELRVFSTHVKDFTVIADEDVMADGPFTPFCLIEFMQREGALDPGQFRRSWEALSRTAKYPPGLRFVLNHITEAPPPGYEFDGVSELWVHSAEQAAAILTSPGWREYLAARAKVANETATVTMMTRITHSYAIE